MGALRCCRQQTASSLARQAISEARHRGLQLGPTYRPQRASPPRRSSSSAATVASQRRRAGDRQHGSAAASPLMHEVSMNTQGRSSASSGLLQGRRITHAASRGSMHNRTSSHQQPPERPLQLDSQLPSYPPSSPRLRGADNTLETTDSGCVLPVPSSSGRNSAPCEHHQRGRPSTSGTDQGCAQQAYSLGLPIPSHQYSQHRSQPWSNPALSAPVHSGAVSGQVQQPREQQQFLNPYVQLPRPALSPSPEALPPLPPGPPPDAAAGSVSSYRQQAAAAASVGSRDDSSDSSSSQLASQQHSIRRVPGVPDGCVICSSTRAAKPAATKAADDPPDNAQQVESPGHSRQVVGHQHSMTKQQAADAVKALIKPLYVAKGLSKDQFKTVAQSCTHALANADRCLADSSGVREVVRDCLTGMGLSDAAAQL